MKKVIFLLSFILLLCGCSQVKVTDLTASLLLPQEKVAPYLEYSPETTEINTRRSSVIEYRPSQRGAGDPVIVTLYRENELMSRHKIKSDFDKAFKLRSDGFSVDSLGAEGFVAYPSIHCYKNGCHIEITAGSGSDNDQKVLFVIGST